MRSIVHSRQTLLDIVIQECGSFEAVIALAGRNGLSLTDDLAAGMELEYSEEDIVDKRVVVGLADRGVKPATAISRRDKETVPWGGIGFMGIEIDFVVSE